MTDEIRRKRFDSDDEIRTIEGRNARVSITIERAEDGTVTVTGQTKLTAQMRITADTLPTRPGRTPTDDSIEDVVERVVAEVDRLVLAESAEFLSRSVITRGDVDSRHSWELLGMAVGRRLSNGAPVVVVLP